MVNGQILGLASAVKCFAACVIFPCPANLPPFRNAMQSARSG